MIFEDLIFIHIPKTAGSSIQNSLTKQHKLIYEGTDDFFNFLGISSNKNLENKKIPIISFKRHLPLEVIKLSNLIKDKPIITFVRNPFSRAVSLYYECMRSELYINDLGMNSNSTFEDFLYSIEKKDYWFTMPMIDWIGENNLNNIGFIGKIENIEDDIKKINNKYQLKIKVKYHNYNNSLGSKYSPPDYTKFYTKDETIKKVEKIFLKDLTTFKYSFEDFKISEKNKTNKLKMLVNIIKRKLST